MTEEIKETTKTTQATEQKPIAEEKATEGKSSLRHRELIKSLVISFVALFLLAGATYAWFSDEALTKGSSISAGFMGAELLIDEELLQKYWNENPTEIGYSSLDDYATQELKLTKYERTLVGESKPETYYDITNKDLKVITLKSVEPGQVYPITFYVANIGDLAFTYSAGFSVAEGDSLTGSERLVKEAMKKYEECCEDEAERTEKEKWEWVLGNYPDYKMKWNVLFAEQWIQDPDWNPETAEEGKAVPMVDNGGHLEDVLKVYIGKDRRF